MLIGVTWHQQLRRNGSIEICAGHRLVAIVTREHPDMIGNAIAIAHAPAMIAALLNLATARRAVPDPHAAAFERHLQALEIGANLAQAEQDLARLAERLQADYRNARPPRRKRR